LANPAVDVELSIDYLRGAVGRVRVT